MALAHTRTRPRLARRHKLLLVAGFLSLAGAVNAAVDSPVSGYELSIYGATPTVFWLGIAVALLTALLVGTGTESSHGRLTASLLAAVGGLAVVGLPLTRGYYFYGQGDALTHLGYARSLATGSLQPQELLYPGVHLLAVGVSSVTGLELQQALLLAVVGFFGLFILFVPLCVREMTDAKWAVVIGTFAALLFLPINAVGTHIVTHPSSEAILFAPFVFFLALLALRLPTHNRLRPSQLGVLFVLAAPTMLLLHPQESLSLLVVFTTIVIVQGLFRRFRSTHPIAQHRPLYFETLLLGLLWLLWVVGRPRVTNRIEAAYEFILGGSTPAAGGAVAGRSASLTDIGGSLGGLFVKLFLAAAVFSLLAAIIFLGSPLGRFDDSFPEYNAINKYLAVAFIPLTALTTIVFVGNFGDHYFRFIGFLMLPVTLVGAAALAKGVPRLRGLVSDVGHRRVIVLLFVLLVPLTMFSLHPSPWIYQENPLVTEQELTGYESALHHQMSESVFLGIRGGSGRFVDALYGPDSRTAEEFSSGPIPYDMWTNVSAAADVPIYVPIQPSDTPREVTLYRGFRYSAAGFESLHTTDGIHRVQSTGGFELYLVNDE